MLVAKIVVRGFGVCWPLLFWNKSPSYFATMPKQKVASAMPSSTGTTTTNSDNFFFMILSPAKTLDLSPMEDDKMQPIPWTRPSCSPKQSYEVMAAMKEHAKNPSKLNLPKCWEFLPNWQLRSRTIGMT
jgi:hypothetical protein